MGKDWLYNTMDCGDNSCFFRNHNKPSGMRTNGGCRCFSGSRQSDQIFARKMFREIIQLRKQNKNLNQTIEHLSTDRYEKIKLSDKVFKQYDERIEQLQKWVDDLQSGMYINCVYCGHRYGPDDEITGTMREALHKHISECPEHPMSKLEIENRRLWELLNNRCPMTMLGKECKEDRFGGCDACRYHYIKTGE